MLTFVFVTLLVILGLDLVTAPTGVNERKTVVKTQAEAIARIVVTCLLVLAVVYMYAKAR